MVNGEWNLGIGVEKVVANRHEVGHARLPSNKPGISSDDIRPVQSTAF